jgi:tetratricopeptide (TPR) repeat protein
MALASEDVGSNESSSPARWRAPFVGRVDERNLLRARFEQATEGEGQVVLLLGEAGIGKSRLARILREDLADCDCSWLETGGNPYCASSPFYAMAMLLKRLLRPRDDDGEEIRFSDLVALTGASGLEERRAIPLLAPLVGVNLPSTYQGVLVSPEAARRQLLATLERLLLGMARGRPLVFLVEDLQWVDPSSLDLLQLLAETAATAPLLLLLTARPEFRAPWHLRSHHTHLTLNRLARKQVRELFAEVAHVQLRPEQIETLLLRTGGVPLFVEELALDVLQAWTKSLREMPATLAESLAMRLQNLPESSRSVAAIAAVIGREVSHDLLCALTEVEGVAAELESALHALSDSGLLRTEDRNGEPLHIFRHALLRDAIYQLLSDERRHELHWKTAAVLRDRFAGRVQPELLAYHWTEAGDTVPAVEAWREAAAQASRNGAFGEAVSLAHQGLALLKDMAEGGLRDGLEFDLQATLGNALVIAEGYGSADAQAAFARLQKLSERSGDPLQSALLLVGHWTVAFARMGPLAVRHLAEHLCEAEKRSQNDYGTALANFMLGVTLYQMGDLAAARECFESVLETSVDTRPIMGVDLRVVVLAYASHDAWHQGLADDARALMQEAVERAEEGSAADRAFVGHYAAALYVYLRDPPTVRAYAQRALAACTESPNQVNESLAALYLGWALAREHAGGEGIAVARDGLERFIASGQRVGMPGFVGQIADAHRCAGEYVEALAILSSADDALPGDQIDRADILRRRADLLALAGAAATEVEETYRNALATARRHGDKAYELRAATAYAGWLRQRGRSPEGRALLEPIYGSFVQGLDTPDLLEARELLGTL